MKRKNDNKSLNDSISSRNYPHLCSQRYFSVDFCPTNRSRVFSPSALHSFSSPSRSARYSNSCSASYCPNSKIVMSDCSDSRSVCSMSSSSGCVPKYPLGYQMWGKQSAILMCDSILSCARTLRVGLCRLLAF